MPEVFGYSEAFSSFQRESLVLEVLQVIRVACRKALVNVELRRNSRELTLKRSTHCVLPSTAVISPGQSFFKYNVTTDPLSSAPLHIHTLFFLFHIYTDSVLILDISQMGSIVRDIYIYIYTLVYCCIFRRTEIDDKSVADSKQNPLTHIGRTRVHEQDNRGKKPPLDSFIHCKLCMVSWGKRKYSNLIYAFDDGCSKGRMYVTATQTIKRSRSIPVNLTIFTLGRNEDIMNNYNNNDHCCNSNFYDNELWSNAWVFFMCFFLPKKKNQHSDVVLVMANRWWKFPIWTLLD